MTTRMGVLRIILLGAEKYNNICTYRRFGSRALQKTKKIKSMTIFTIINIIKQVHIYR